MTTDGGLHWNDTTPNGESFFHTVSLDPSKQSRITVAAASSIGVGPPDEFIIEPEHKGTLYDIINLLARLEYKLNNMILYTFVFYFQFP